MAEALSGLKVYPTWEILERTDPGEWSALDAASKELYHGIISAGTVRFTTGSLVRDVLLVLFPVGSITGDKLRLM
jgi:hypothetical protein